MKNLGSSQNKLNIVDLDIYISILSLQKRINIIQLLVPLILRKTVNDSTVNNFITVSEFFSGLHVVSN